MEPRGPKFLFHVRQMRQGAHARSTPDVPEVNVNEIPGEVVERSRSSCQIQPFDGGRCFADRRQRRHGFLKPIPVSAASHSRCLLGFPRPLRCDPIGHNELDGAVVGQLPFPINGDVASVRHVT